MSSAAGNNDHSEIMLLLSSHSLALTDSHTVSVSASVDCECDSEVIHLHDHVKNLNEYASIQAYHTLKLLQNNQVTHPNDET
jgi:hypothetical protein